MRSFLLIFFLVIIAVPATAQAPSVIQSKQSGNWDDRNTWVGGKVPRQVDGAEILSGHTVTLNGIGGVFRITDLIISGTLSNGWFNTLIVRGNYSNNGTHSGIGTIQVEGATISGTGTITNIASFDIINNKTILAGTNLTKNSGRMLINGIYTVTNYGSITLSTGNLEGADAAGSVWINADNSILGVGGALLTIGILNATAPGNTVNYRGAVNQTVKIPASTYYNLTFSGANANTKTFAADIIVTNDFRLAGGTVALTNYNLYVGGNWINTGGINDGASGTVLLNKAGSQTISHATRETFYHLVADGSGTKLLSTNILVNGNLTINSGLDVNSISNYTVDLKGNWVNNGAFNQQKGSVLFTGSTAQAISGINTFFNLTVNNTSGVTLTNSQNLTGTLSLAAGTFTTTGYDFTLVSNSFSTARIGTIGSGTLAGNIIMQRYFAGGADGWHFLGTSVTGRTLADWSDDFIMTGFPGSQYPTFSFVSIYTYDETAPGIKDCTYVAATDITNPVNPGVGIWAYIDGASFTLDVTGPPVMGNFNLPVSFTANAGAADDGWNMIGNPYPSTIDWDAAGWTKTNINNAVYIWDPSIQNYTAYSGGVGVNGGSRYIPSTQAFWVQANAASPVLTATESVKSAVDEKFRGSENLPHVVRLTMSGNGYSDEAAIRFLDNATASFDAAYDAGKLYSFNGSVPILTTVLNNQEYSINALPALTADVSIPLRAMTYMAGTYTITADMQDFAHMSSCIMLEDTYTGTFTDLRSNPAYTFTLSDTTSAPRFIIHISAPITKEAQPALCQRSTGAAIAKGTGNGPWDYTWRDYSGAVLKTITGSATADTLASVPAGIYYVTVSGTLCTNVTDTIAISEPAAITVAATAEDATCANSSNGRITIDSISGGNAPYTLQWSSGGSSPNLTGISPGTYSYTVTDANGCMESGSIAIASTDDITAFFTSPDTILIVTDSAYLFTHECINAESFIWDFGDGSPESTEENPSHIFEQSGSYTVTLTARNSNCMDTYSQPVTVALVPGFNEEQLAEEVKIYSNGKTIFCEFDMEAPADAVITLYNSLGQQTAPAFIAKAANNKIEIAAPASAAGIYFVRVTVNNRIISGRIRL